MGFHTNTIIVLDISERAHMQILGWVSSTTSHGYLIYVWKRIVALPIIPHQPTFMFILLHLHLEHLC
jgi:hypothetical protein